MNRVIVIIFMLVLIDVTLVACESKPPYTLTKTKDLVFANGINGSAEWKLDSYAPDHSGDCPVVLFLPGWGESKEMMAPLAKAVSEQGAIFYVIDYPRIENAAAIMNKGKGYRELAEVAACAVRFARSASDLDCKTGTLVVAGASYGGGIASHVALAGSNINQRWEEYAASNDGPAQQVECTVNAGSTHVDALVGVAGTYYGLVKSGDSYGRDFMEEKDRDLWQMLAGSVGENQDLKVRLLHSETDSMVPYENSVEFETLLSEAGYDVELSQYAGDHIPTPLEPTVELILEMIGE